MTIYWILFGFKLALQSKYELLTANLDYGEFKFQFI